MTEKQYFLYGDYEAERKKPIKELWPGLAKWNAEAMQAALDEHHQRSKQVLRMAQGLFPDPDLPNPLVKLPSDEKSNKGLQAWFNYQVEKTMKK